MNLNLYGHQGKWLMVDLGISFADDTMPGLDVIMPDPAFIVERRSDLVGLVVTHAHEDHLGAVQYLWPELRCPVYCTPFTASFLRAKLHERGLSATVPIVEIPLGGTVEIGPFSVEYVTMTHSIPEPNALAIRTSAGTVLHTGDWKLDPDPLVGDTADEARLRAIGDEGVLALVGDSTNALVPGSAGSEATVRASLMELFGRYRNARIAVSCFATNVARLESIAAAAAAHDRHVALVGRSLWRINEAARANGYLAEVPKFLSEHDASYLPREKLVLICTGSQGEPRSALARIAADDHPQITLSRGDVVIFSSREIPGNERAIGRMQNQLVAQGIELVTADDAPIHVSGHPARDELVRMYQWVRPRIAVPVHGEQRHQQAHAALAEDCQVAHSLVPANGELIRLDGAEGARVVANVRAGRMALDGKRLVPLDTGMMRARNRMVNNGAAVVTLVMTGTGELLTAPQVAVMGLIDEATDRDLLLDVVDAVREAVALLPRSARADDAQVKEAARIALRRCFNASHGKKPVTEVHLVRV
ncbi:RNA-metabolising metallo-beta-lactamase [Azospirillum thiophilum]|uniref:RNA-metabolising metallo-beta-lactamase n=2 Tax=Azospirillum thiophilum TaxID=528244 RepID=A0AAC8VZJ1_9PROT|nr:RNA-metabolising metallo-beta-lactamase [Azospirillum thiophilum]KJR67091.1 RNA-metabolising metallo-beta-lactamase [Azospirillum thiophilum]